MLNKPILHKTIPYIDEFSNTEEAFNYMAKILNSSFTPATVEVPSTTISPIVLDGVELSLPWTNAGFGNITLLTYTHDLGVIPTKWIIVDDIRDPRPFTAMYVIYRTAWTTTTITIRITCTESASGTLRILVLR